LRLILDRRTLPRREGFMMRTALRTALVVGLACASGLSTPAAAQATRTWVSGVGDDLNPCSRTAPCKTFAGAIAKTASGGEINCLDPAGYGSVTINKPITIVCDHTEGGVLSAGNGIVVNLSNAADGVLLSGLDIFGTGTEGSGLRVVGVGSVHLRNSVVRGFRAGAGLSIDSAAMVLISDSTLSGNRTAIAANGPAQVIVTGSTIVANGTGVGGSARILSGGGNLLAGNGADGRFAGTVARQ
jgi:hypothetical protein